jgi:hypothetical protein
MRQSREIAPETLWQLNSLRNYPPGFDKDVIFVTPCGVFFARLLGR